MHAYVCTRTYVCKYVCVYLRTSPSQPGSCRTCLPCHIYLSIGHVIYCICLLLDMASMPYLYMAYIHTYIHTYVDAISIYGIHTYIHTYIHTHTQTYIPTYICWIWHQCHIYLSIGYVFYIYFSIGYAFAPYTRAQARVDGFQIFSSREPYCCTACCIYSVIPLISKHSRLSSSLRLFCHVPLKRDELD